jgi:hypothetical protein
VISSTPSRYELTNLRVISPEIIGSSREAPQIRHVDLIQDDSQFYRHLANGTPVVVTEVKIQGEWDPAYFAKRHGDQKVILEDCETGKKLPGHVSGFFSEFGKVRTDKKISKIKVQ